MAQVQLNNPSDSLDEETQLDEEVRPPDPPFLCLSEKMMKPLAPVMSSLLSLSYRNRLVHENDKYQISQ